MTGLPNCFRMLLLVVALVACQITPAPQTPQTTSPDQPTLEGEAFIRAHYDKQEVRIPMRDGVTLFTAVYSPKDKGGTYPIILLRTPYSVSPYGADEYREKLGSSMLMAEEKFIFAYQDVRGRFMSEGEYVNMRPHIAQKRSATDVDESSDTYDTVAWLVENIPNNNGKVGMWGISYPGFYAAAALIDAHPALKAVSPQAPIADWYFDDFHHHGAFFLAHAFRFLGVFGLPRDGLVKEWPPRIELPTEDGYRFFLEEIGPLSQINDKYYKNNIPFWNEFIAHPNYDEFWQARNLLPHLGQITQITPAAMTVGGWYDAEDLYGTFKIYQTLEERNPQANNTVVIGPWPHGGWSRTEGTTLGNVYFGDQPPPSKYYLEEIELPFFKHLLKDDEDPKLPEAHVFETGVNCWRKLDSWPPENRQMRALYLGQGGALTFEPPTTGEAYDEFISDPARPVPSTDRITHKMPKEYMTDDQRFAATRPDVLVYKTGALDKPITLAGPIQVSLHVSTSQTDADWVVKLIDVYPDDHPQFEHTPEHVELGGYQQMVRSEVMRGRYRESYEHPKPFVPGEVTEVRFELLDVLHTFKKGHRLMVHVQSTWFPMVDRNPQRYVDNIYHATAEDFVKATHRVYRSADHPSSLTVGVVDF